MSDYEKKIQRAIALLRAIPQDTEIEVAVSGGKDSDVILQLAKEAVIPFRAIHKCTTIDPPGTLKHVKELGCEIRMPEKNFFELIREKGTPSRWRRHCCSFLKEYKICDRVVIGVRRSESSARAKRYIEPEQCRNYGKGQKAIQYYPILDWTDEDVERFIKERELKCAPAYYDEQGNFHVERRLGCLCCPLQNYKKRCEEFKKYPKMLKLYIQSLDIYMSDYPNSIMRKLSKNAYNRMFFELFCDFNPRRYNELVVEGGGFLAMS